MLLCFIGGSMIRESRSEEDEEEDVYKRQVLLSGANAEGTRVRGSLTVLRQDDNPVRLVSWNPDRSTMS